MLSIKKKRRATQAQRFFDLSEIVRLYLVRFGTPV